MGRVRIQPRRGTHRCRDGEMTPFQAITERTIRQNRRVWACQRFLAAEAAKEMPDAQPIVDELDDAWEAMERLHVRIRHHIRRLENKMATDGNPLSISDRHKRIDDANQD